MGLFSFLSGNKRPQVGETVDSTIGATQRESAGFLKLLPLSGSVGKKDGGLAVRRLCRVEQLENREMLSANPIQFGATYYEDVNGVGDDGDGDVFQTSWVGGVDGTQLKQITISTDKNGNGQIDEGECFFDPSGGGLGTKGNYPFTVVDSQGVEGVHYSLSDDGTTLTITFDKFDEGGKFIFKIDVDELNTDGVSAIAEGKEFEGTIVSATFVNRYYNDETIITTYMDDYCDPFTPPLNLPDDTYGSPNGSSHYVLTAGAFGSAVQTPKPITISGNVFEDANRDNVFDATETGIANVYLELHVWDSASNAYVGTGKYDVTNSSGFYQFENVLPGKYRIVETQPDGYWSVGSKAGTVDGQTRGQSVAADILAEIELLGGENSVHNDFGEIRPGALSGYVYEDNNDNGIKDANEAGIGNVTLELYKWDAASQQYVTAGRTTITDNSSGYYEFKELDPDQTYMIVETQPLDYLDGKDRAGSLGGIAPSPDTDRILGIHVGVGQFGRNYNFGELKPSSISGHVAVDQNGNNYLDSGDLFLADIPVNLYDANGNKIATTKTDENGYYIFNNLKPGIYKVTEEQPAEYYDGPDFLGTEGGELVLPDSIAGIPIMVADTHGADYDFLEYRGGSIEGFVYEDENNNGVKENGENGIGGVVVILWDGDEEIARTVTDENGRYKFDNLEPGKVYAITEEQPDYCDGKDAAGTLGGTAMNPGDRIEGIAVSAGAAGQNYNFGELKYSSLAGYVYEDWNNDGNKDTDEPPLQDVTLQLWVWNEAENVYQATGRIATTDTNGHYQFDNICPYKNFRIVEVQPDGYISGKNKAGDIGGTASDANDWITDIILTPDVHADNYNFGELREAKISGYVYEDVALVNGQTDMTYTDNGVKDTDEKGIADVTIDLYKLENGSYVLVATTTTDTNGFYEFRGLNPGTYQVVESQPEDYFDGQDAIGSIGGISRDDDDLITAINVFSGANGINYNFGELTPCTISGYVFQDGDTIYYADAKPSVESVRDGVKKSGDKPLGNVVLVLCDRTGMALYDEDGVLITAITDANGYYEFNGLTPEQYGVREIQPQDYEDGINTPGSKGGLAQSPGHPLDAQQLTLLAGNDPKDLIFSINVNYGEHAANNNFSEVVYSKYSEPPILPIPPTPPVYPGVPSMPLGNASVSGAVIYTPPVFGAMLSPGIGGAGVPTGYSWHLSVINAGYPRSILTDQDVAYSYRAQGVYTNVAWEASDMGRTEWIIYHSDGRVAGKSYRFGPGSGIPVAGDFNGDGVSEIAIYNAGFWYVDVNGNGVWDANDLWAKMGSASDQPVVGDWDGDGKTDIGVFGPEWSGDTNALAKEPGLPTDLNQKIGLRPKNVPPNPEDAPAAARAMKHTTRGRMRLDVIDHVFRYGAESDKAVTGNFSGDGTTQIGVYRNGTWYIDYNGNGYWDSGDVEAKTDAQAGDVPIVGDFTGEGIDRIGLYTPSNGRVIIDSNGDFKLDENDRIFYLEGVDDVEAYPVVGDFTGDGIDQLALVKHLDRIPMQTRVVTPPAGITSPALTNNHDRFESVPLSIEAPTSPALSSEFQPGDPVEVLNHQ
ncbi:MAG: carboxypeptidase regulatory-like domain-containing protein [Planctomycetaceae bacterium]|nr:carboxypeptidase regulatory-like domain-containing protein [Planctomycetaceae bacterium]